MNIRDIEHMWKVASNNPNHDTNWHDPVVIAFANLVAAQERDFIATKWENLYGYDKQGVAEFIRKRANTQGEQHEPTKDYNWCKHCYRNPHKNGHTPFCPATGGTT
jgi:hypothetical protein